MFTILLKRLPLTNQHAVSTRYSCIGIPTCIPRAEKRYFVAQVFSEYSPRKYIFVILKVFLLKLMFFSFCSYSSEVPRLKSMSSFLVFSAISEFHPTYISLWLDLFFIFWSLWHLLPILSYQLIIDCRCLLSTLWNQLPASSGVFRISEGGDSPSLPSHPIPSPSS